MKKKKPSKPAKKSTKKPKPKAKKKPPRAKSASRVVLAAGKNEIVAPASGVAYDTQNSLVNVRCQLLMPPYTAARARIFLSHDPVTVATGDDTDGYTALVREDDTAYFSADVLVAEVYDTVAPPANNNKVMVWAYDDADESDTWDPVGVVYFKVYDSTIGP